MATVLAAQPMEEPVTLAEAKLNLRVDGSADDTLITALIKMARMYCEGYSGLSFVSRVYRLTASAVTSITLPNPPLLSVNTVTLITDDGARTALDTAAYTVDILNAAAPTVTIDDIGDAATVEIVYSAGNGTASDVPETVKSAMQVIIAGHYLNREGGKGLADAYAAANTLLNLDRVNWGF